MNTNDDSTANNHRANNPLNDDERLQREVDFIERNGINEALSFTSAIFTKATFPHSA